MRNFIQLLLALLTLAAMVWASWQGYLLLKHQQLGLEQGTRPVVVIFCILALVCTFIVSAAIGRHGDATLKGQQFESRLAIYQRCIAEAESGEPDLTDLNGPMVLVASSRVLKEFNALRQMVPTREGSTSTMAAAFEKLLLAMREDLGQSPDWLVRKEIQRMFK
jgi:hypothetical protein